MSGLSKSTTCAREWCQDRINEYPCTHIVPSLHANQKPNRQTYLLCKSNGLAAQLVSSLRNLRQIFAHDVCISFHARLVTVEPNLKSAQGWKLCSRALEVESWCEHLGHVWIACVHEPKKKYRPTEVADNRLHCDTWVKDDARVFAYS